MRTGINSFIENYFKYPEIVNLAITMGGGLGSIEREHMQGICTFISKSAPLDGMELMAKMAEAVKDSSLEITDALQQKIIDLVVMQYPFIKKFDGYLDNWNQFIKWQALENYACNNSSLSFPSGVISKVFENDCNDLSRTLVENSQSIDVQKIIVKKMLYHYVFQSNISMEKYKFVLSFFYALHQDPQNIDWQKVYLATCQIKSKKEVWAYKDNNGELVVVESLLPEGRLGLMVQAACHLYDSKHFSGIIYNNYQAHRLSKTNGKFQKLAALGCSFDTRIYTESGQSIQIVRRKGYKGGASAKCSARLGVRVAAARGTNERVFEDSLPCFAL